MIAPVLGVATILTLVMTPDSSGNSVVGYLMNAMVAAQDKNTVAIQGNLNAIVPALLNGLTNAIPLAIGTAIAGIVGRLFRC